MSGVFPVFKAYFPSIERVPVRMKPVLFIAFLIIGVERPKWLFNEETPSYMLLTISPSLRPF